ncbi:MAG: hypothetical protein JRH20_27735 [Deltaproteobacteria bacterium]|nr:hypothetical protein [Deltaproteobacteria bacterium]
MPIRGDTRAEKEILLTIIEGEMDDEQLIAYYQHFFDEKLYTRFKRELIDGRSCTKMSVTAKGQKRLGALLSQYRVDLTDYRAAMVATTDVVYGMFRMWEMGRGSLGYELKVFREEAEARSWLAA